MITAESEPQEMQGELEGDPIPLRSESDIICMKSEVVLIGGQEYEIKPAKYKLGTQWRNEFADFLGRVNSNGLRTDTKALMALLNSAISDRQPLTEEQLNALLPDPGPEEVAAMRKFNIVDMGEQMLDLVKLYSPYLDWEALEEEIYDYEIGEVFRVICRMALPFRDDLRRSMETDQPKTKAFPKGSLDLKKALEGGAAQ